ncbi:hypothetical protein N1028_13520 [Herbiconiux sp. CPCC 203407]|uniref:Uncharacterized protein n=1 Tax=Herbiconiux oxytropis TaxID=2970915 RepID=A0AA41XI92_9MICO|nr:hypothetical protein [Herbiconiux oxytropis]MCS5724151.1 hypothetical protein [Herbiconiux oxytropis]MCS5726914.1 hypothetical protein [Herbiconiux oxytropis]
MGSSSGVEPAPESPPATVGSFSGVGPSVVEISAPPSGSLPDADGATPAHLWVRFTFDCDGVGAYTVIPTADRRLGARGVGCGLGVPLAYSYRVEGSALPGSLIITVDEDARWTLDVTAALGSDADSR